MRLAAEQLAQHLESPLRALYVVHGDEPLGLMEATDAIRASARKNGYSERESYTVERGFNWQRLQANSQSLSLFSTLKIIEIHIPSGKPGTEGSKALQAYVSDLPPDTLTLITLPRIEKKEQGVWYQKLEQAAMMVAVESVEIDRLPAWIGRRLSAQGQQGDTETLEFIANQVEGNLLAAHQEIQKLGLLFPQGRLSIEEVRDAVLNVSRFDAFQLGDAMLAGDASRTAKVLDGLQAEGVQAVALLGLLIWLLRGALKVKTAQAQGADLASAFGQAKIWGERQNVMRQALNRLSLKQLQATLLKAAEIDKINKGLEYGSSWLELSRLCLGVAKMRPSRK
ncbi:MAG TPA: DNA polymerase III subunit delta [Methylophilaceae bacterium]